MLFAVVDLRDNRKKQMPVSQRNKVVSVGKVEKKSKEHRQKLYGVVAEAMSEYTFIYVLQCTNQRNQFLKQLRETVPGLWVFGKTKMINKVFTDHKLDIARYVKGEAVILMTNEGVVQVQEALKFSDIDYARQGMKPDQTIILEQLARSDGEALPSSMLDQLKKLNLDVKLEIGKIILNKPYTLCQEGKEMTNEQCQVAKMFWMPLAKSFVRIIAYYDGKEIKDVDDMEA